jgi:class 3 adenylate cyclase
MVSTLVAGREALERRAWAEAREALQAADGDAPLSPDDLQLYSEAAWWSGYPDEAVDALERAYSGYVAAGENSAAAMVAVQLTYLAVRRLAISVAAGWMGNVEHLLEGEPESEAHAWLALLRIAEAAFLRGDLDGAIERADEAIALARKLGVPDVEAQSLSLKGSALVNRGDWEAGMALIDQATAAATSGELDIRSASNVYCSTMSCCALMGDYRRAGEWTEEADRWMQRHSVSGYPGECKVHRAELKRLRGAYSEAEQEARVACEELERYHLLDAVGMAHYEVGEVRLRRGDLDAAEQAFTRAYEYGSDALPGLALLMLARGDVDGAAAALSGRLAGGPDSEESRTNRLARVRLLPAQITVALAREDLQSARTATDELEAIAAEYAQPVFEACALAARGALMLHEGQAAKSVSVLDRAWRQFRDVELPYESALARTLLGTARTAAGDESTARMDLIAARTAFDKLGAVLDVRRLDDLLGEEAPFYAASGQPVPVTLMFTDIVTSTDLVRLIGDAAWKDMLHWHDRTLRSEFGRQRGREVRHTGDGFFVAFERAADAVEAAVSIQRRLAEHRSEHGFSPWVRIGIHTTEATPEGSDFSGHGVHVAARVGDIGDRDEIVISSDTLSAAGGVRFAVSDPESTSLKGVEAPVIVHRVDWRT